MSARYRMAVFSRATAAICAGYALSAASAASMSLAFGTLGMPLPDAVMAATLLAFVVQAVAAIWAFSCATVLRAWLGLVVPAIALALLAWLLGSGGAA